MTTGQAGSTSSTTPATSRAASSTPRIGSVITYLIEHPGPDIWIAQRKDNRETPTADDPEALRDRIRADYLTHPVSRRINRPGLPGGAGGSRFLPEG